MTKKIPTVAIVGRTNVGKSTLFNALVSKRSSIVENLPGVTRDRIYGLVTRFEKPFSLIDTGGLVGEDDCGMQDLVRAQAEFAIDEADLLLVVFDGIEGLHPLDEEVVRIIRKSKKPSIFVVNKVEKPGTKEASGDFYRLGIDDLLYISAAHRGGIKELGQEILSCFDGSFEDAEAEERDSIRVAIIGKPNVGKSTLLNKLIGNVRVITSPIAGTTRDSVDVSFVHKENQFVLVDTAGLRKKARVSEQTVERYANIRALSVLSDCDVAVLVLDAFEGVPSDQDKKIASLVHERGRALVIVYNKWDIVEKDHKSASQFKKRVHAAFNFCSYAPVLFVSAVSGRNCLSILDKAKTVCESSKTKVQTSKINDVVARAFKSKPPPVYRGAPIKHFFSAQIDVAPPTFAIFLNFPTKLPETYVRYIKSVIRQYFPFEGTDIRLVFKKNRGNKETLTVA